MKREWIEFSIALSALIGLCIIITLGILGIINIGN